MPAYAIAHLRSAEIGPDIVRYLEGIDATLEPFGGRSSSTAARRTSGKGSSREP